MSTPLPPDPPTTPAAPQPERPTGWRRFRPRGRAGAIGAVIVAVLVVGGVVAALLVPWGHRGGPGDYRGPAVGLSGESSELGDIEGLDDGGALRDGPGRDGPGRGRGDRPGARGLGQRHPAGRDGRLDRERVTRPHSRRWRRSAPSAPTTAPACAARATPPSATWRPGERVVVRVTGTGDAATAVAVVTPRARVTGTVTALTGDSATVTGVNGLTVTVDVAGLGQKPAVGDLVVLTGTAANGTTLKADQVRVLPKAS